MSLQSQIEEIILDSGAHMGVAARHLESDETLCIAADDSFPMCSVLKIPVLVEAFRQMELGAFSLTDRWDLTTDEKNLGSGTLRFMENGLQPTVLDLLTLMIIISDNTATDMLIHHLGLESINQTMHDLGLTNIHMVMTIRQIFESILPSADPTQDQYELAKANKSFDPKVRTGGKTPSGYSSGSDNNVSTPRHMTELLTMIYRGTVIKRAACDAMLDILLKQQLNDRLPRFLPPGTRVAHKTGTLTEFRNDAGVIYVNGNSHVAVTVFSRWDAEAVSGDPVAERQRTHEVDSAFGYIGRALFDHFQ